jgi:hypothetical protein
MSHPFGESGKCRALICSQALAELEERCPLALSQSSAWFPLVSGPQQASFRQRRAWQAPLALPQQAWLRPQAWSQPVSQARWSLGQQEQASWWQALGQLPCHLLRLARVPGPFRRERA